MVFANINFSRVKCHFRMLKRDFTKLKKDLAEIEEITLSKKVKRATNKKSNALQEEKHRFLHRKALLSIECNRGIKNEEIPSSFHDTPSIILIKPINVNASCLP